jgi:hypothetical protein
MELIKRIYFVNKNEIYPKYINLKVLGFIRIIIDYAKDELTCVAFIFPGIRISFNDFHNIIEISFLGDRLYKKLLKIIEGIINKGDTKDASDSHGFSVWINFGKFTLSTYKCKKCGKDQISFYNNKFSIEITNKLQCKD